MKEEECYAIILRLLDPLTAALGLSQWSIEITCGPNESRPIGPGADFVVLGQCHADENYRSATIRINNARMENARDVLANLTHELIHVVITPFDTYHNYAACGIRKDGVEGLRDEVVWNRAAEQTVINVELLLKNQGFYEKFLAAAEGVPGPGRKAERKKK